MQRAAFIGYLAGVWAAFWTTFAVAGGHVEPYALSAGDRVSVRVVVWQDSEREFVPLSAINGEYQIAPHGVVTIPIAGAIEATNLTTAALADQVAEAVRQRLGRFGLPSVVIEVVEYSPFFLLGDVARPGAYPATPGMTALQAFAQAGGGSAAARTGATDLTADLRDAGTLRQLQADLVRARIAATRLKAEVNGEDALVFPEGLRHPDGETALAVAIEEERRIFHSRRDASDVEATNLRDLIALLDAERAALDIKLENLSVQVTRAEEALATAQSLVDQGLALAPRLDAAQRRVFDLQSSELDLQNGIFRADQRKKEAERDLATLGSDSRTRSAIDLQNTNARIESLITRRDTVSRVMIERGATIELTPEDPVLVRKFEVERGSGPDREVIQGPDTALRPGDVVTVITEVSE